MLIFSRCSSKYCCNDLGRDVRKPVFGVFDQVPTQTRLYSHRRWLETWNFGFGKQRYCTIQVAKTKALISFAVTAKLICVFVFAYAKIRFSHVAAHFIKAASWSWGFLTRADTNWAETASKDGYRDLKFLILEGNCTTDVAKNEDSDQLWDQPVEIYLLMANRVLTLIRLLQG